MLRIVSHNVYWFQGHPFGGKNPGAPNDAIFGALIAVYRELNADLLCLQEVQDAAAHRRVQKTLNRAGWHTPGAQLPQYGTAAYAKIGRNAGDSLSAPARPQRAWQRIGVAMAGRKELLVANCHLPSSAQVSETEAKRLRVEELRAAIGTDEDRKPHVVLGDFNEVPGGGVSDFLEEQEYRDVAVATGQGAVGTVPRGKRGDQIWIHENLVGKIAGYGVWPGERLRAEHLGIGKEYLSDHFPLWVDLDLEPSA